MAVAVEPRTIFVITNKSGEIVGAFTDDLHSGLAPGPDQKMHKIEEVPEHILTETDFHKLITEHFKSKSAKVSLIDPVEHRNAVVRRLIERAKMKGK
jgi:hypothetical protein